MTAPDQLKWSDAPSVGPGARIAVIEGPLDKPVPFTREETVIHCTAPGPGESPTSIPPTTLGSADLYPGLRARNA